MISCFYEAKARS